LILVIALLVIPPASARFWTDRMLPLVVTAALVGGVGAMFGAAASALAPRLPSGAMIVVTMTVVFLFSMVFGRARGVLPRYLEHRNLSRRILQQNLLRALYEWAEQGADGHKPLTPEQAAGKAMPFGDLLAERSWSAAHLRRLLLNAQGENIVAKVPDRDSWYLTGHGLDEARRVVRNHRLWETFLVHFADVAPSHVDRDADAIEHVLEPAMPGSPHAVGGPRDGVDSYGRVSA
jgi:manganese/zinc/iron transport system permease protein